MAGPAGVEALRKGGLGLLGEDPGLVGGELSREGTAFAAVSPFNQHLFGAFSWALWPVDFPCTPAPRLTREGELFGSSMFNVLAIEDAASARV